MSTTTDRMMASPNRGGGASLRGTPETVRTSVDVFVGKAGQSGDFTVLCLEYRG